MDQYSYRCHIQLYFTSLLLPYAFALTPWDSFAISLQRCWGDGLGAHFTEIQSGSTSGKAHPYEGYENSKEARLNWAVQSKPRQMSEKENHCKDREQFSNRDGKMNKQNTWGTSKRVIGIDSNSQNEATAERAECVEETRLLY